MSRVVFLRGAKTVLRPPSKADSEMFQKWINDPEVRCFLSRSTPTSLEEEEKWIEALQKDKNNMVFVIETHEGTPIGTMSLHGINWIDGVATTGALIGEKDYWGQGYGTDAKMVLLYHVFCNLGLRKICSAALATNPRSIAYSKKVGYHKEGVLKNHTLRDGRYIDHVLLAIFKPEFMKSWRIYKKKHKL
jgi:RimJ/RimL family protein N-acetyltransferase